MMAAAAIPVTFNSVICRHRFTKPCECPLQRKSWNFKSKKVFETVLCTTFNFYQLLVTAAQNQIKVTHAVIFQGVLRLKLDT